MLNTHRHMHWGILVVICLVVGNFLIGEINLTYHTDIAEAADKSVITQNDIVYKGAFEVPGDISGFTIRYINGVRHFLYYHHPDNNVKEIHQVNDPGFSALAGYPTATLERTYTGGLYPKQILPNSTSQNTITSLYWDETLNRLYWNHGDLYGVNVPNYSIGASTLNDTTNTITDIGCYAFNQNNRLTESGILPIPSWFSSQYLPSSAYRLAAGFGSRIRSSLHGASSLGPTFTAYVPDTGTNNCPDALSFLPSKILQRYEFGTDPIAARTSNINYRDDYQPYTNPVGNQGYWSPATNLHQAAVWVDTPNKTGVLVFPTMMEGDLDTTVLASPPPTSNSATLATVTMKGGKVLVPGDVIYLQTATGPDAFNDHYNGDVIRITGVNGNTITYAQEGTGGRGTPAIVGGFAQAGDMYIWAHIFATRYIPRWQVYSPYDLGRVAQGSMNPYDPDPTSEWTPTYGQLPLIYPGSDHSLIEVTGSAFDPVTNQIFVAINHVGSAMAINAYNIPASRVYVYSVNDTNTPNIPATPSPSSPPPSTPSSPSTPSTPTPGPTISLSVGPTSGTGVGSLVQSGSGLSTGTVTLSSPVTAGNTLVVAISGWYGTTIVAPTDGINTYTKAVQYAGPNYGQDSAIYYAHNIAAGTPTIHVSGGAGAQVTGVSVMEIKGDYVISDTSSNSALSGTPDSGASTITGSGFAVGLALSQYGSVNMAGTGWTKVASEVNAQMTMYRQIASAGNYNAIGNYVYTPWEISIATFKPSSSTTTPAPAPSPTPLAGDLDGNGIVNGLDWSIMRTVWFTSNAAADLNHDGIVNSIDFSILNRNWFRSS